MKLVSLQEAADRLNITRQYVWMLVQMGRIRAQKVGRTYVIRETDLKTYISKKADKNNSINQSPNHEV